MEINTKITRRAEQATSAEIVASIDDLLMQILSRPPIRSLMGFNLVSKRWRALITTRKSSLLRNPHPAIGLFLPRTIGRLHPKFEYVHLDAENPCDNPPFKKLKFTNDPGGIHILNSCNGLLLCSSFRGSRSSHKCYYIYNPTTKQHTRLPELASGTRTPRKFDSVNLAFDPCKSPYYKVVSVWSPDSTPDRYQIEIYSSETGLWRVSGETFSTDVDFETGVYWNGSIHWINTLRDDSTALFYNVDLEFGLGTMPMPPINGEEAAYFGESGGHLHLITRYGTRFQFHVYEMKRDYSDWFVKYQADLEADNNEFPKMMLLFNLRHLPTYAMSIFALVRGETDEDSFLVLQIPGQAIRYNIGSKTFQELGHIIRGPERRSTSPIWRVKAVQYIESLSRV